MRVGKRTFPVLGALLGMFLVFNGVDVHILGGLATVDSGGAFAEGGVFRSNELAVLGGICKVCEVIMELRLGFSIEKGTGSS